MGKVAGVPVRTSMTAAAESVVSSASQAALLDDPRVSSIMDMARAIHEQKIY
jgi:hypothetical protein